MSSISNKREKGLTGIFLAWILIIIVSIYVVTMALASDIQTKQSEENAGALLQNVVDNVFLSLNNMEELVRHVLVSLSAEDVAEFYGRHIQTVKEGGIIIVKDGVIIGDAIVDYLGQPIEKTGISVAQISGESGRFGAMVEGTPSLCFYETRDGLTVISLMPDNLVYAVRNSSLRMLTVVYAVLFAALYVLIAWLLRRFVLNGIRKTNASLVRITDGNLDEQVTVRENREFSQLSAGINATVEALKESIEKETARIDDELRYARAIQGSALPKLDEMLHDARYEVAAKMLPAKEVGGDFYDFFEMSGDRVCAVIADVSGKGIPAALYMMSAMDRVRGMLLSENDVARAFSQINNMLCSAGSEMFVTLFAAVIDFDSAQMDVVNAGHNSPLVCREDGVFEYLADPHDFVLAGMDDMCYHAYRHTLRKGDVLFIYTDGVTECMDDAGTLFGEERLAACLNGAQDRSPDALLKTVQSKLSAFMNGAEQSDDITMLALRVS